MGFRSVMVSGIISSARLAALAPVLAMGGVLLILVGCGAGKFFPPLSSTTTGTSTSSGDYLYVGENGGTAIAAFTIASTTSGSTTTTALSALSGSPFTAAVEPVALAVTPDNDYLYVSSGDNEAGLDVYPIESDGALNISSGGLAENGYSPAAIAVDSTGGWLFGIDPDNAEVYVFQIGSNGALTGPYATPAAISTCSPGTLGVLAPGLVVTPSSTGDYVYASCGTAGIYALSFDPSSNQLTYLGSVSPSTTTAADSGLAVATYDGASYLLAAETVSNTVRVFTINSSTGALNLASDSPTGDGPDAVLVDSTDSYVYAANRSGDSISGFTIGSGGALTAIGSPFTTCTDPVALAEDKTHTYVATVCEGDSDLETYTIGGGGALASFNTSTTGVTAASSLAVTQ